MTGKTEALARKLAAEGKTDAAIDRAIGESNWTVRRVSYEARRDAGLIPNRVGSFDSIEDVRASDVRSVLAVAPKLRAYALPIVFGFAPGFNASRHGEHGAHSVVLLLQYDVEARQRQAYPSFEPILEPEQSRGLERLLPR